MHPAAMAAMSAMLKRYTADTAVVLDVGSFNVNGSYRPLIENKGWQYTGADIRPGDNVDIMMPDPDRLPFDDESFDIVISGSTMEHVARPWRWLPELARVLKPGGLLAIVTHWSFKEHRYPCDYWRFMPDGLHLLFDDTAVLEQYDIRVINSEDIIGSAFRVVQ